jgi:hypothetical protein
MNATLVRQITGPGTSTERYGFLATDLGYCALAPDRSRMMTIFGDTFRDRRVGAGEWMSPVLMYSDPAKFRAGLDFNGTFGPLGNRAVQQLPYTHNVGGISTVLPSGLITVGDTAYLFATVSSGYPAVRSVEIQVSKGDGGTWKHSGVEWRGDFLGGFFQMFAPVDWGDGFVYLFSSGFQRDKGVILHRVPKDKILDKNAYVPWGWTQARGWQWGQPASVIFNDKIGEMTAEKIGNDLVLCYFNGSKYRVEVAVMTSPTDNLITCPKYTAVAGAGWPGEMNPENWQAGTMAQVYGGHIVPGSTHDELHIVVSQWRNQGRPATDGWPYLSVQFKMKINNRNALPAKVVDSPKVPTPSPAQPEGNPVSDADKVFQALQNDNDKVSLHVGRRDGDGKDTSFQTGSVREMVKNASFEQTLWLKRRSLESLRKNTNTPDTQLGHSVRAASHAAINTELLAALCKASGIDVNGTLAAAGILGDPA